MTSFFFSSLTEKGKNRLTGWKFDKFISTTNLIKIPKLFQRDGCLAERNLNCLYNLYYRDKNWNKKYTTILIQMSIVIVHGNRARRHRRQTLNGPVNQNSLSPNRQILNDQQQRSSPREKDPNEIASRKQDRRQYGYGLGGSNYPYGGGGFGSYGYGQYGQGLGQSGSYYNRYPGSYGGYSGYNRPDYYSSNYYPSMGSNYYGGYFWNHGQKQYYNKFLGFTSLLLCSLVFFSM
ncbi:unnamed protein product [Rotaria socialis]